MKLSTVWSTELYHLMERVSVSCCIQWIAPIETSSLIGTGEHGVGVGKKEYLVDELGENTIELMRSVKKAIDPLNIMNPSKVSICCRYLHQNRS